MKRKFLHSLKEREFGIIKSTSKINNEMYSIAKPKIIKGMG